MKNLFLAINHCHSNGVVHRDLKPENIMYMESNDPNNFEEIKIIDFGLSKQLLNPDYALMKTLVGTPYYVAPEVLEGQYGQECDCWSLGVIMYAVLSGCLPFYGRSTAEVFEKIKTTPVNFGIREFKFISEQAKDLISKLLNKNKSERLTCAQALKHPWFTEVNRNDVMKKPLDP